MDLTRLDDAGVKNLVDNHRRQKKTDAPLYAAALEEWERRKGRGLKFETTRRVIQRAAAQRRFLTYQDVARASGVEWTRVRHQMGSHLTRLCEYAHHQGWPLISSIVVNKEGHEAGDLRERALGGFIGVARMLGYVVTDEEAFLREQQEKTFRWAQAASVSDEWNGLRPQAFQEAFSRFRHLIAARDDGRAFTHFHEGIAAVWEGYKPRLREYALRLLAADEWTESGIGSGKILRHAIEAIEIQNKKLDLNNNLVFWQNRFGEASREHQVLLEAVGNPNLRQELERLLFGLYRNGADEGATFDRLSELTGRKYPLLAYLYFLKDMDRFMPIQPTTFDRAFRDLKIDLVTLRNCSWENYQRYNAALEEVRKALATVEGLSDIRLVDAHSFCWMLQKMEEAGEGEVTPDPQDAAEALKESMASLEGMSPSEERPGSLRHELPEDPFTFDPPNVWLTSFWDFAPERWGYVGFTQESDRRGFIAKSKPGCLVVVYVTRNSSKNKDLRGKIIGIIQVSHEMGPGQSFMPGDAYVLKEQDPASQGKWDFGVRAIRAWRVAEGKEPLIDDFAPATYRSAHAQMIGGRGVPFVANEAMRLLDLEVREIAVYGARRTFSPEIRPLREELKTSRAVPRATSPYLVDEDDSPKKLYILRLKGDIAAFLGKPAGDVAGLEIIKVGYSKNPDIRCMAFNQAMPECAFEWEVFRTNPGEPPYPSWQVAQAGEDAMKQKLAELQGEPLGREFFLASSGAIERAWRAGQSAAQAKKGSA